MLNPLIEELKRKGYQHLRQLPESQVLEISSQDGGMVSNEQPYRSTQKVLCSVDEMSDGRLRVVVQSCAVGFCCMSEVESEGFMISPDDAISEVPPALMSEFRMS